MNDLASFRRPGADRGLGQGSVAPPFQTSDAVGRTDEVQVGRLLGIARHDRPRGPMETVDAVEVTEREGVHGDFRGSLKPGRNKRQVTLMAAECWRDALAEIRQPVAWEQRRVNLLVEGLHLKETTGARVLFPSGLVLEVTGECDPCSRMEEVSQGLKAALLPHWRGGINTRVIAGGRIAIGDQVRIEW